MRRFRFEEDADVAADIREKFGFDGDLLDLFANNSGAVVHKWHHYIPLYDRYFAQFRGKPIRFLEIGVNNRTVFAAVATPSLKSSTRVGVFGVRKDQVAKVKLEVFPLTPLY